jgi:hypothetical protein
MPVNFIPDPQPAPAKPSKPSPSVNFIPDPPAGYTLDQAAPPLPPGYTGWAAPSTAPPSPPPGYTLDFSSIAKPLPQAKSPAAAPLDFSSIGKPITGLLVPGTIDPMNRPKVDHPTQGGRTDNHSRG